MPENNPIQSAERIFHVLEFLAESGPTSLTELSEELRLSKSTTHRMLLSLCMMGYVRKDDVSGKYELTFKLLEIAGRVLERVDILPIAHRYLEQLMRQTHETVHFVQRDGNSLVYVDKVESDANSIRMVSRIGLRLPMFCTGVGKAMLAEMPLNQVEEIWNHSSIRAYTQHTITNLDQLLLELEWIRSHGYALDNEENELGVRCIAACVHDFSGKANNAFSVSAPISRMSDDRIRELSAFVLNTKKELSRELGYRFPSR